MKISATAHKYAEALLDVAAETGSDSVVRIGSEVERFRRLLAESSELKGALHSPAVPFSAKRGVVEEVSRLEGLSPTLVNLLLVLLENGRIRLFDEVVEGYREAVARRAGIVAVEVTSARPLSEENRRRLTQVLEQATGGEVDCRFDVDASLVGGLKLQIGSRVFDGTVSTRLEEIRSAISGAR